MTEPKRIQRKRTKGWRMPANTVSVTRPGRWGNPFKFDENSDAAWCVCRFRDWLLFSEQGQFVAKAARRELRGKNLACWCAEDQPCHADVLLQIANTEDAFA